MPAPLTPGLRACEEAAEARRRGGPAAPRVQPAGTERPAFFRRQSSLFFTGNPNAEPDSLLALLATAFASGTIGALATAALFAAWIKRMRPPTLHYSPTPENEALLRDIPMLLRTYVPNILAWNAHTAGFFGYVKLPKRASRVRQEVVTLPDGGTVALSWSSEPLDGQRVIICFPGINNPSDMGYIMHLSDLLHRQGLGHVAAVDWRGLGGQELRSVTGTPKPYSAAAFGDVGSILTHLRARLPSSPIIGVGWSMGGGMLLRHMGEAGEACELAGAMAVSPLVDLAKNYEHMGSKLINSMYLPIIMGPLLAYLFRHRDALAQGPRACSFWHDVLPALGKHQGLDDCVYGPTWGLAGKEEYWEVSSARPWLGAIRRPTLIVHSEDDPICPVSAMPLDVMAANPFLFTAVTRHGGHMGYTAGLSPLEHTWTDRLLVHFLHHLETRAAEAAHAFAKQEHSTDEDPPHGASSARPRTSAAVAGKDSDTVGAAAPGRSVSTLSAMRAAPPLPVFSVPSRL